MEEIIKIKSAEFVIGAVTPEQFPKDNLPQIAFGGKSNVGKSSLINTLLNRKNLVKTSSTPGKTREINFFKINDQFYFVDLPGYGYAKAPKGEQKEWGYRIETYFKNAVNLKGVVLLLDIRREVSPLDFQMIEFLKHFSLPFITVLTKTDKISKNLLNNYVKTIQKNLNLSDFASLVLFSAITKKGKDELWKILLSLLFNNYIEEK